MRTRTRLALLTTAAAMTASGVAYAGSGYPTSLSIGYSPSSGGSFAGKLRSHSGCVDGRKVVVFRKEPGSDPAVGNDRAAPSGSWLVSGGKVSAGDYYAKTKGVTLRSGAKCAGAKSASTHVS